jgi:17beta-estradiol 17-dehydrogenase / very-long-chain 3-oxoacyl-CoA reductase
VFVATVVVTGATDGIGKAYAQELARQGLNIVLISRSEEKLQATAEVIASSSGVQTKIIAVDFSEGSQQIYDDISDQLKDLDIGVLINNVGVSYEHPEYFCEVTTEGLWQLVNVNVAAVTFLSHALLPSMVEKRRGAVINISSFAGFYPLGLLAVYSATKSYVTFLTEALQQEYSGRGITIQSVNPLIVVSKMSKVKQASFFAPSPDEFVHQAIGTIGYQSVTVGCFAHQLQYWFLSFLPSWIRSPFIFSKQKETWKRVKAKKNKSH